MQVLKLGHSAIANDPEFSTSAEDKFALRTAVRMIFSQEVKKATVDHGFYWGLRRTSFRNLQNIIEYLFVLNNLYKDKTLRDILRPY